MKTEPYAGLCAYVPPAFANLKNESVSLACSASSSLTTVTVTVNWQNRQGSAKTFSLATYFTQYDEQ